MPAFFLAILGVLLFYLPVPRGYYMLWPFLPARTIWRVDPYQVNSFIFKTSGFYC